MWKLYLTCCIGLCFAYQAVAQEWNAQVQTLMRQVILDSLLSDVRVLSGESPVVVAGRVDTIASRVLTHEDNDLAADYLKQKLKRFGLETEDHFFNDLRGRNVIGIQRGVIYPDEKYIICAHYDAETGSPGADDNASGTAAVLEAARVLSTISTAYSIIYILWDEEEIGMEGSKAYAREAADAGELIRGVVNLDMIAWDQNDDGVFTIHHRDDIAEDVWLKEMVEGVNTTYATGLVPLAPANPTRSSDHSSFWRNEYPAVLLIEHIGIDYQGTQSDFNPYYHSSADKIERFNTDYYYALSSLAMATIAHLAEVQSLSVTIENDHFDPMIIWLGPNYPNPFEHTTFLQYSIPVPAHVKLTIFDILGREVETLLDARQTAGTHTVTWHADNVPSGVLFYRLTTETSTVSRMMQKID